MLKDADMKIFTPAGAEGNLYSQPAVQISAGLKEHPSPKPACPAHRECGQILRDLGISFKI